MENKTIFFIGIGGISMSGLAQYVKNRGYNVNGSDISKNEQIEILISKGIKVFIGHKKSNIKNADVVVYNSAIAKNNPELIEAKKRGIKILSRAELLSAISKEHKHTIAIAGTHGKTTTTAMIGEIFYYAGLKPTVHLGGVDKNFNTNFLDGEQQFFITEACEYKENFLSLKPDLGVVINIDNDHMEYFKSENNLKNSFITFINNCNFCIIFENFFQNNKKIEKIGAKNKYCWAENIKCVNGKYSFDAIFCGEFVGRINLNIFHKHNVDNALFGIAVAKYFGIDNRVIVLTLENFCGVKRRFEKIQNNNDLNVIIDYAHHPSEIQATLTSAKLITKGKLFVIFQPHTYSRTKKLFDEFVKCFKDADYLFLYKTYPAREGFDKDYNSKTLCQHIKKIQWCKYYSSFLSLKNEIKKRFEKDDTLLILGAGDIYQFADYFISNL